MAIEFLNKHFEQIVSGPAPSLSPHTNQEHQNILHQARKFASRFAEHDRSSSLSQSNSVHLQSSHRRRRRRGSESDASQDSATRPMKKNTVGKEKEYHDESDGDGDKLRKRPEEGELEEEKEEEGERKRLDEEDPEEEPEEKEEAGERKRLDEEEPEEEPEEEERQEERKRFDEEEPEEQEEVQAASVKTTKSSSAESQAAASGRVAAIKQCFRNGMDPVTADELVDNLLLAPKGTQAQIEDQSLVLLLRSYEPIVMEELVSVASLIVFQTELVCFRTRPHCFPALVSSVQPNLLAMSSTPRPCWTTKVAIPCRGSLLAIR